MKTATSQEKKIEYITRRQVTSLLREILSDPDAGRRISVNATLRLKKSQNSANSGHTKNLRDVLRRYSA